MDFCFCFFLVTRLPLLKILNQTPPGFSIDMIRGVLETQRGGRPLQDRRKENRSQALSEPASCCFPLLFKSQVLLFKFTYIK